MKAELVFKGDNNVEYRMPLSDKAIEMAWNVMSDSEDKHRKQLAFEINSFAENMYVINWEDHWKEISDQRIKKDFKHFEIFIADYFPIEKTRDDVEKINTQPDPPHQYLYQSTEPPKAVSVEVVW